MANFNSADVSDGVVWSGIAVEGDAEIAGPGLGLTEGEGGGEGKKESANDEEIASYLIA